jgi:hypothetical protein
VEKNLGLFFFLLATNYFLHVCFSQPLQVARVVKFGQQKKKQGLYNVKGLNLFLFIYETFLFEVCGFLFKLQDYFRHLEN